MKAIKLAYEIKDRLKLLDIPAGILKHDVFHLFCNIAKDFIYIRVSNNLPTSEDEKVLAEFPLPLEVRPEFWVKTADRKGHFRRFILIDKKLVEHFQIYIPSLVKIPKTNGMGCVYFMLNHIKNIVKIGYSNNAKRRLYEIRSYQTDGLELIGKVLIDNPSLLEKELHEKFITYKIKGEWFEYSKPIKDYIETYCQ